jgi:hypothetical protein
MSYEKVGKLFRKKSRRFLPKLLHDLQLPPWDAPILLGLNVS